MEKQQLQRLKDLLSIPTYTWEEQDLINYLKEELNKIKGVYYYEDKLGCLYITKGYVESYPVFCRSFR